MPRKQKNLSLFEDLDQPPDPWQIEQGLWALGYRSLAGVDEAGRGPLAGPVVAAAVILEKGADYPGVSDSKKMNHAERERAFRMITRRALGIGVGIAGHDEIDQTNILKASLCAMARAVDGLRQGHEKAAADFLMIDGSFTIQHALPQKAVPHGDMLSVSIGAASIIAKVVRDRIMLAYACRYPEYGFASHKGYGTKAHLDVLERIGPCPIHRLTFRGVRR